MAEDEAGTPSGGGSRNGAGGRDYVRPQPGRSRRVRESKRDAQTIGDARAAAIAGDIPPAQGTAAEATATGVSTEGPMGTSGVAPQPGRSRREREARRAGTAVMEPPTAEPTLTETAPAVPTWSAIASEADVDQPSGGDSLRADSVIVRGGAVGRVETSELTVATGAIGAARAEHVSVEKGAIGAAMADRVEVSRGYARSILARQVQLDRAAARVVVAAEVRAERTAVLFLVARRVAGDVKVLFDWRGAIAFGAVAGLIAGVIGRARRPKG